jgi:hypothetical protein
MWVLNAVVWERERSAGGNVGIGENYNWSETGIGRGGRWGLWLIERLEPDGGKWVCARGRGVGL